MSSFKDLGLGPAMVEALGAHGIETPSDFQEDAVPVVRRGNNLIGRAGPGAGTLVAYGAPLLDRLPVEGAGPAALILVPTRSRATALARSLGGLARSTGHVVSALSGPWALPQRADVLFATPAEALGAVEDSRVKLDGLEAFVVDGADDIRGLDGFEAVETLAEFVPSGAQRVLLSLPLSDELDAFVEGHIKRGVHVPPKRATDGEADDEIPRRGTLRYRIVEGDRLEAALRAVGRLLEDGARHVLVHFHSDDEAADVGDALTLHGYVAGAPGDESVPVWLGTRAAESRALLGELDDADSVATLSYRVPLGPDALDRRHARGRSALTLLRGRELPHLEAAARIAGYRLDSAPEERPVDLDEEMGAFRARLQEAVESRDLAPYLLLLEPLTERHGTARVAAAAAALLRARGEGPGARAPSEAAVPTTSAGRADEAGWVRLFMSLGTKDDAGPGDILGAITGEAGVEGSQVGRIDIRDTFSLVEVDRSVAQEVIESMNGTTVKGRSLRVDFDRSRSRKGGKGRGKG